MKFSPHLFLFVFFIFFSFSIHAEEELSVDEDTIRFDESLEDYKKRINKEDDTIKTLDVIKVVGSKEREDYNGHYIITKEMIENSGSISVADVLAQQPSIYVETNGTFGQSSTIKLNGSPSQHVLILLDGIKLDDPSNAQPFFDIGQIPLSFVEEIEIIKGPSGVLYGSGAIAGVINIKTKKYKENIATVKQEAGSFNSLVTQVGTNININNLNISLFGNFYKSDGYSIAQVNLDGKEPQNDKSQVQDLNLKLSYMFSENAYIDSFFKISNSEIDYDGFEIYPIDAENNHLSKSESLYYFSYNFKIFSSLKSQLKFSQNTTSKKYEEMSYGSTTKSEYFYNSKEQLFGYKASYANEDIIFIGGVDFETKKMDVQEQVINDFSFYGNIKEYISPKLSLEQGFRTDQNQRNISLQETTFSRDIAYNLGLSYNIDNIDSFIKLNMGQSYRSPSLYELFGNYGRSSLNSEVSRGVNLEFSSTNFYKYIQQFNINIFYTNVDDMIYFVDNRYSNIGNYTNIGFDVTLPFYIDNFLYINDLKIRPSYTYINSHDNYTNTNSTIIPEHKFNTSFDIDITPKYHLSWNMLWVSSTTALNDGKEINMPSYFLNNAMLSMKLKKLSKLYLKVENVFNEQYQTSYGYNTKDRGYYFGIIVDM